MHKQNILRFKYYSKTGTLSFYCRYYVLKSLVVSASDTTNMGLKIVQNLSTEARHRICNCYGIHAIIILNDSVFSEDFIWYGKLFQTLGPKTLKLLHPKVTWLCTDIFKFNIIFSSSKSTNFS